MEKYENKIAFHLITAIIYFIIGISLINMTIDKRNMDYYCQGGYEFINFIGLIFIIVTIIKIITIIHLRSKIKT